MEMATETARQPGSHKHQRISRILKTLDKKTKPFQEFWTKFNNDWSWNNAAGLAYNLILSIFPLVIALLALIGLFLGRLILLPRTSRSSSFPTSFPKSPHHKRSSSQP